MPYTGIALDAQGKPLAGETGVTFLIFKDEQGGEPLFAETQSVVLNNAGQYKVQLGATLPNGLPSDLFATGEARWLEVQIAGQAPQHRALLSSVPYALKAADATTFNGLPLSAFVLAGSKAATAFQTQAALQTAAATASTVTTTGGTSGAIPLFTGAATIANANIFQNTTGIGINTSTPSRDTRRQRLFRPSRSGRHHSQRHGHSDSWSRLLPAHLLRASPTTPAPKRPSTRHLNGKPLRPATTLRPRQPRSIWLYSNGTTTVATGFSFNANGTINFAPGQTFPGSGNETITGVTAGAGLTGGGATGNVTLNVDATKVPLLAASTNAFTGSQSVGGNLSVLGSEKVVGSLNAAVSVSTNSLNAGTGTFTQSLDFLRSVSAGPGLRRFCGRGELLSDRSAQLRLRLLRSHPAHHGLSSAGRVVYTTEPMA